MTAYCQALVARGGPGRSPGPARTVPGDSEIIARRRACGRSSAGRTGGVPNVVARGAAIRGKRTRIGWTPTDCRGLDADDGEAAP